MRLSPLPALVSSVTDEDLIRWSQDGDAWAFDALIQRYRRFVRAKARGYFLVGGDADDIEQEGMIGLYKSIRDYRPDREASFRAFADLCVTRQIITAIKTASRQKHQPLNRYVSISQTGGDDNERSDACLLDDHCVSDPADAVVSEERMGDMRRSMDGVLSDFELGVLRLYVEGRSYHQIGERLGRHVKSIDNALQRIKRKLELHLADREAQEASLAVA